MNKTLYVGLDVHKDTITVAVAEDGRGGEIRFHGTIVNSEDAVLRLTMTLTKNGCTPSFCYEAGPCWYGIADAEMLARLWRGDYPEFCALAW